MRDASTSEGATYTSFPPQAAHPAGPAHLPHAPGSAAAPATMAGPVPGVPAVPMPVTGMPMPMPVTAGAWCNWHCGNVEFLRLLTYGGFWEPFSLEGSERHWLWFARE